MADEKGVERMFRLRDQLYKGSEARNNTELSGP